MKNHLNSESSFQLILASSSPFRRELLERLRMPFECISPEIDESSLPSETPQELVARLAKDKATRVGAMHPQAWVIASDQVGVLDGHIMTKPLQHDIAVQQLQLASGRTVTFLTGLCLHNVHENHTKVVVEPFEVDFHQLSDKQIEAYLKAEAPYQCAGSFKSEGLGITLFTALRGSDPNALVGLPLIELCRMLREAGLDPLLTE